MTQLGPQVVLKPADKGSSVGLYVVDGEGAIEMWIASEGHCRAIMNPDTTHIGPGFYPDGSGDYGSYWTLAFTRM